MKKIILLVENNQSSIEIIQKILQDRIFRITITQNEETAKDLLKHARFDLLITETQLPKSHGFILSKYVSEHYPATKIIIISEKLKQEEYKQEAITQHGADDFFEKPLPERLFRRRALELMGIDDKKLADMSFSSEASTKQHVLPTLEELAAYRSKTKTGESNRETPKGKDNIPVIHIDLD
ncbi:MAG TPA: response regulator [Candidatus Deferrimicrobium sp.]|nr:response regulator [Candidatus Deferrimicrobium sp.]